MSVWEILGLAMMKILEKILHSFMVHVTPLFYLKTIM